VRVLVVVVLSGGHEYTPAVVAVAVTQPRGEGARPVGRNGLAEGQGICYWPANECSRQGEGGTAGRCAGGRETGGGGPGEADQLGSGSPTPDTWTESPGPGWR